MNLVSLGIDVDDESMRKITERIIELGDKTEMVTTEDLPYIISDVLHHDAMADQRIRILNYSLSLAQGLRPVATLKIEIDGEAYEESASGDGQYDAFVRADVYKRQEYAGEAIRNTTMEERLTICNLSIEMGARGGMIAPDQVTFDYLKDREFSPRAEAWEDVYKRQVKARHTLSLPGVFAGSVKPCRLAGDLRECGGNVCLRQATADVPDQRSWQAIRELCHGQRYPRKK